MYRFLMCGVRTGNKVRKIFDDVESHEDRLELNLYIVGESGDEEEGTMSEAGQEQ